MQGVSASLTKRKRADTTKHCTVPAQTCFPAPLLSVASWILLNSTHQQNTVGAGAHGKAGVVDVGCAAAADAELVGDSHAHTPAAATCCSAVEQ